MKHFCDRYFLKKNSEESGTAVHFSELFDVCLNRRQLGFHSCLCIQSVVICFWLKHEENLVSHR